MKDDFSPHLNPVAIREGILIRREKAIKATLSCEQEFKEVLRLKRREHDGTI